MRESIKKMAKITILNDDAVNHRLTADMIVTDPPFEMSGEKLYSIVEQYDSNHIVLICSMKQLLDFYKVAKGYKLSWQLVMELCTPNRPIHYHLPAYTHCLVVYFIKNGEKSKFSRKNCQRHDVFEKSYFPSLIKAPRERREEHGHAKNQQALQDILACFEVESVIDMFAGSGTTGLACLELDLDCTLIEKDTEHFNQMKQTFEFLGAI